MSADYKRSSRFAVGTSATITHLAAHVDGLGGAGGTQQLRFAIYTDESGQPQGLLAQSAIGTVNAGEPAHWLRLALPSPLSLATSSYHLAILSGPTGRVARYSRAPATAGLLSAWDAFADGASTSYGSRAADNYEVAIHALDVRPPANLAPPEISGTAQVGERLTASPGSWSEAPHTYSYEWRRCDAGGAGCTAIAGADQPSYTLVPDDAGATVRVAVTAFNSDGGTTAVSAAHGPVAAAPAQIVFGRDVAGDSWYAMGADYKRSSRFTLTAAATITHLVAHVDGLGGAGGTQQLRYAIYADESGQPQGLLAQSGIGTISAGEPAQWLRLALPSPLSLTASTYHLAILSGPTGGIARYSRAPAPAGLLSAWDAFADGASTSYGAGTADNYEVAVHALYDPDVANDAPDPPTALSQTGATTTSVDVAWNASTDRVPVEGYRVFVDGIAVGTTAATVFSVTGLACGRTYTIGVEAFTAGGNVSSRPTVVASTAVCPPGTIACDKVAAPGGSDSNAGTLSAPYRTPQKLADTLAAGQTGCLRGGSYSSTGTYVLNVSRAGFRIRSYPGERARLIGIVMIRNTADAFTLSHLDIEGSGTMNTIKVHSDDVVIEDNTITNARRGLSCMMLGSNDSYGGAVRTIVRRNRFHDCGSAAHGNKDHGIYTANLADGQIVNNVFWNTAAYAIHLYPNARRARVAYNVIDGDVPSIRGGIIVAGDSSYASNDNVIELNVVAYSQTANIETYWQSAVGSGNVARKNCLWAGKEANIRGTGLTAIDNLIADPLFVDRSARDYRLASDSPCLGHIGAAPGP